MSSGVFLCNWIDFLLTSVVRNPVSPSLVTSLVNLLAVLQAQSASVAEIWLWHIDSWRVAGQLRSHTLTVTQMEFSHNNRFLLSVSRDRHLSIYQRVETGYIPHYLGFLYIPDIAQKLNLSYAS
jgi:WD40 repeat protein